jgi:hypothetical protein
VSENLNKNQFYFHGTTHEFNEGDELTPQPFTLHGPSTGKHVYMTDRDFAEEYAEFAAEQRGDVDPNLRYVPRVYMVEPIGEVEVDPSGMSYLDDDGNETTPDRRAAKARIVKKVWEKE